jgi:hypothetical protein
MWGVLEGRKRNDFMCAHYEHYLKSDGGEVVIMKGIFWQLIIILIFQNLFLIWLNHSQVLHCFLSFSLVSSEIPADISWVENPVLCASLTTSSQWLPQIPTHKIILFNYLLHASIMIRLGAECVRCEVRLTTESRWWGSLPAATSLVMNMSRRSAPHSCYI